MWSLSVAPGWNWRRKVNRPSSFKSQTSPTFARPGGKNVLKALPEYDFEGTAGRSLPSSSHFRWKLDMESVMGSQNASTGNSHPSPILKSSAVVLLVKTPKVAGQSFRGSGASGTSKALCGSPIWLWKRTRKGPSMPSRFDGRADACMGLSAAERVSGYSPSAGARGHLIATTRITTNTDKPTVMAPNLTTSMAF